MINTILMLRYQLFAILELPSKYKEIEEGF